MAECDNLRMGEWDDGIVIQLRDGEEMRDKSRAIPHVQGRT
jgi:hypothetical protein